MINFDASGQGFWDFVLSNGTDDFIAVIQKDLDLDLPCYYIADVTFLNDHLTVYLKSTCSNFFITHEQVRYADDVSISRQKINIYQLDIINKLMRAGDLS